MGIQIGGEGQSTFDPLLAQMRWQQQQQQELENQAYSRNLGQAQHTAQAGAANESFHIQQDALARHAAEVARQQTVQDRSFTREGDWHAQENARHAQEFANLQQHQKDQLAFQQAEEARRVKAEADRQEMHKADMEQRLQQAAGATRKAGVSKYETDLDRAMGHLQTEADRYGAPLTSEEVRAQAERDMQMHQFAPPNTTNGPLLPQFEKQPSDFQRPVQGPDVFPPEDTGVEVSSPSPKWAGGPMTMPEMPVDAHAVINETRRNHLADNAQAKKDSFDLRERGLVSREEGAKQREQHLTDLTDRYNSQKELKDLPYTDLKAQVDAEKDPAIKAAILEAAELSARGKLPSAAQFKSNKILSDQYDAAKQESAAELAANREAFDAGHYVVKTPEQIWKAEHKKDAETLHAVLRVKNEKPVTAAVEETPRIGVRGSTPAKVTPAKVTPAAGGAAPVHATTFGAVPEPKSKAEYDALPRGTRYMKDGIAKIKG